MKDSIHDIQLIEKFLDGKMTPEEKREFEQRLNLDQSLKEMMNDMNVLLDGIKASASKSTKEEKLERLRFFAEINDIEKNAANLETPARVVPLYRSPWLWSAAASIVLVTTIAIYFVGERTPLNEKLYTAYFQPFDSPGGSAVRGGPPKITLKAQAYQAYDSGNYAAAAQLFEQLVKDNDDAIAQMCLGNTYLEQGKTAKAEKVFTDMLAKQNDLLTPAKWYLALTYLKENKLERAKAALWEVSKSSTYGEKAQQLLKKLD